MLRFFFHLFSLLFKLAVVTLIVGSVVFGCLVYFHIKDLPDYKQLAEYNPSTVTRLYSADGKLLEEYAKEHRIFVPINAVPRQLIQAFLAAEDKNFYSHPGIDVMSVVRAILQNIMNISANKSLVGGSTITQQVVKNFLLTNEKSLNRKVKEAILAFRITQIYSKDRILELYLNQIYLGSSSYGVASAALNYFNKSIDDLTLEEAAFLAALPKAPSNYDPKRNYDKAFARRNWVIAKMYDDGFVTKAEAASALAKPISLHSRAKEETVKAEFFAEEVRKEISAKYGSQTLYSGGLVVHTTLDPQLQEIATKSFRAGLISYDMRRGYRGSYKHVASLKNWPDLLAEIDTSDMLGSFKLAIVLKLEAAKAVIGLEDGSKSQITLKNMAWAKSSLSKPSDILKTGDVIVVEKLDPKIGYGLRQIPKVSGGMIVMDPHTGRILAMVGGLSFNNSEFNRAMQAKRQPGSVYKPFVYLTALENGFTPASIILDGPISLSQGAGLPMWQPRNYSRDYLGPTTLRRGLEKSRNAMTVRLAQSLGVSKLIEVTKRLGINANPPRNLSLALGATETTLLDITNAYAMIVAGGRKITPSLIEYIEDRAGKIIYKRDTSICSGCAMSNTPPQIETKAESVLDPKVAYQMISLLEGVMVRGTGGSARKLARTLGGKTGTTNDSNDAWFVGFTPDLVVGTYVGYDVPKSLGRRETGASVALPIFINFMEQALKDKPDIPFRIPPGIKLVKINALTGLPSTSGVNDQSVIMEAFKSGSEDGGASPESRIEHLYDEDVKIEDFFEQPEAITPSEENYENFGTDNVY
jgi:penicillin-binding protein 1A